ncbi:MAG TPA: amino acid-binding ACT protein [Micrococcales bacterium]|uniref:glycine cleavage system protein R n=1 Tax=Miniimonas arenae TaxID=676201 RepID=UPI000EDCC0D0|nr:ACT domain-containing protein [Miniimonas arenae]HCX85110.1 amino acid-binding ACT protein [Micrococcales bacterium]
MARLILTLSGADRAGLVAAVAEVVREHEGNWEASQLAELAGVFAGVVQVAVPDEQVDPLTAALRALDGALTITVRGGSSEATASNAPAFGLSIAVLGNDHPGIVQDIAATLSASGVSIDRMTTAVREAPMAGGELFDAAIAAHAPDGADLASLRTDLERLAGELQVDITVDAEA